MKLKVLQVHKPLQDSNTVNPEHVQGSYVPHWCVFTERTKIGETPNQFLDRKLEYIKFMNEKKGKNIEGLYLYEITGMLQGIVIKDSFEKEMCYYILYDYIKPKL